MAAKKDGEQILMYKDRPLVRCGDKLYYGYQNDRYVVEIDIVSKKKARDSSGAETDLDLAGSVTVTLIDTEAEGDARKVRQIEDFGLYRAMDVGTTWLERMLG